MGVNPMQSGFVSIGVSTLNYMKEISTLDIVKVKISPESSNTTIGLIQMIKTDRSIGQKRFKEKQYR